MSKKIDILMNQKAQHFAQLFHPLLFQYTDLIKLYNYFLLSSFEKHGRAVYEAHNERVRELVPKERLLEYYVREGWEPLCEWVERDVPVQEIPNGNAGPEFSATFERLQGQWKKEVLWNMGMFSLPVVTVGIFAARYFWKWSL
jgi:hypothetical protein